MMHIIKINNNQTKKVNIKIFKIKKSNNLQSKGYKM